MHRAGFWQVQNWCKTRFLDEMRADCDGRGVGGELAENWGGARQKRAATKCQGCKKRSKNWQQRAGWGFIYLGFWGRARLRPRPTAPLVRPFHWPRSGQSGTFAKSKPPLRAPVAPRLPLHVTIRPPELCLLVYQNSWLTPIIVASPPSPLRFAPGTRVHFFVPAASKRQPFSSFAAVGQAKGCNNRTFQGRRKAQGIFAT